jgi:hypothetical protein
MGLSDICAGKYLDLGFCPNGIICTRTKVPPRSKFGVVGKKLPAPRPMLPIPPTGMRAGLIRSGTYNPSRSNHTARRMAAALHVGKSGAWINDP